MNVHDVRACFHFGYSVTLTLFEFRAYPNQALNGEGTQNVSFFMCGTLSFDHLAIFFFAAAVSRKIIVFS